MAGNLSVGSAVYFNKDANAFDNDETTSPAKTVSYTHLGEVNPIKAHKIGMELCKKILKEDYEFVLATHIDRGHIHNHIICASIRYEVNPF